MKILKITLIVLVSSCASPFLNKRAGIIDKKFLNANAKATSSQIEKGLFRKATFYHSPYLSTVTLFPTTKAYAVAHRLENAKKDQARIISPIPHCLRFKLRTNTQEALNSKSWSFTYNGSTAQPMGLVSNGLILRNRREFDVRRDPREIERATYDATGNICFKEKIDFHKGFKIIVNPNFDTTEKNIELAWSIAK